MEAAALLGFTDIRIVGVDLVYPEKGPTHFFGDGRKEGCRISKLTRILSTCKKVYDSLTSKGITIVNESPVRGPLDDVVPWKESPWLKTKT